MTENVYWGIALTVVVLLVTLRSIGATLVNTLAIPVSLMATFMVLYLLGRTLNIILLAGVAFASGVVVDNATVVLENIVRHREMGKDAMRAALDGASEVRGAILAATLTTISVFVPIFFVQQEAGQLFRDLALAIVISTLLSLVVSVTVVPMLAARLTVGEGRATERFPRLNRALDWIGGAFVNAVVGFLDWLRRGVWRRVVTATAIVVASLVVAWVFMPPMDYLPQGNRNLFFVVVRTPPGYSTEQKEQILRVLEERFIKIPEIERYFAVVRVEDPLMGVLAKPEYGSLPQMREILAKLRRASQGVPGTVAVFATQSPLFRRRGALIGGTNLQVDVKGKDLDTIRDVAARLETEIKRQPGVNFVNSSFEWGNPELQVTVDRERAAALGLTAREVGYIVETAVGGTLAGTFKEGGKEIDIKLLANDRASSRTQDVQETVFFTRAGVPLRLAEIAAVSAAAGPTKVQHVDQDRAITLTVNLKEQVALEAAMAGVENDVIRPARLGLPLGYTITLAGHARDLVEAFNALKWSYILAQIVIYLLMASLFESWFIPFYIMFSVPLAVTGGVLAVRWAHAVEPAIKMDTVTMLGFVILSGIVVSNAILIVHQALNNMREGEEPQAALLSSVASRIRPIFITTLTTVVGVLPLVLSTGAGSELYRGLGSAVLGGLTLSTIVTLLLVPVVYSLGLDAQRALAGRLPAWWRRTPPLEVSEKRGGA